MTGSIQHSHLASGTSITKAATVHGVQMRPVCARQWQKQTPGAGFQT
jgi:hypothetical protein